MKESAYFEHETTFNLIRKLVIFKLLGIDLLFNQSMNAINLSYKCFGQWITNSFIQETTGQIFTGGVTMTDLNKKIGQLESTGVGGIAMYVTEGLENPSEQELDDFADFSKNSIRELTEGREEGHYALKLTALVSAQLMRKMSKAQQLYTQEVLNVSYDPYETSVITKE